MEFETIEHVYEFYKEYGDKGGFGIKRFTSKNKSHNQGIQFKYLTCSREGKQKVKKAKPLKVSSIGSKNVETNYTSVENEEPVTEIIEPQKRERSSARCGCMACIALKLLPSGKYRLYKFLEDHNHVLEHPSYRSHMTSARKLNYSQKLKLHNMSQASIGPVVGHRILAKMSGGYDEVGATAIDCKNFKRDINAYIGDSDCQMVVDMLTQKKEMVTDFSFEYFTTEDSRLGGMFWADENAKRNYFAFGDVVAFDATYRTNKYHMVFIPFTGIDNHGRCVTFASGLLSKEDVISFRWLLRAFKKCYPREPLLILSDQDPAMKIAVNEVFVVTKHRLCMWHITEKVSSKVGTQAIKEGFKAAINKIVWTDKLSTEEFDVSWHETIDNFGLSENRWLNDMFQLRHLWSPTYFRLWPMSGLMRTSSRSESENHMFCNLMNYSGTLVEFFTHFDTAMQSQRFMQAKNDYESNYTEPEMYTDLGFEKDAAMIYTKNKFNETKEEIKKSVLKCMSIAVGEEDGSRMFLVVDTGVQSTRIDESIDRVKNANYFDAYLPHESKVLFNMHEEEFNCSCKYFERFGLLCRHIYYVLRIEKLDHFPRKYICKRWTKNVVPPMSYNSNILKPTNGDDNEGEVADILRQIYYHVELSVSKLVQNKDELQAYLMKQKELFNKVDTEVGAGHKLSKNEFIRSLIGVTQPQEVSVLPPSGIKNKGSGRRSRIVGAREKAIIDTNKNMRKCHYCKRLNHMIHEHVQLGKHMKSKRKKTKRPHPPLEHFNPSSPVALVKHHILKIK